MPTVTTNTAANSALRFLNYNAAQTGASVSKLASGSRIVKASDDAAGLAIGTRLNSDVTVLRQSAINASQGGSIMSVADGGLARIADVLQRLKALAAQSLSGVPTDVERGFIDAEFQSLVEEINGMAATTRFNNASLLDGATTQQSYFVGTNVLDVINVDFTGFGAPSFTSGGLNLDTEGVATVVSATAAMTAVDLSINQISEARANVGAILSRFEFRGQQIATALENVSAARSAIMDVDLAEEQSKLVSSQVLVQASVSALSQANQIPQSLLQLLQ